MKPSLVDPSLVDIGVNLTSKQFRGDLDSVIERARAANVQRMVVTGLTASTSQAALTLAKKWPQTLWCTAGVHPHNAKTVNAQTAAELRALAEHPEVVAIGECGLDYDRDFSPRPKQREAFEQQLSLAVELNLPVFLHERRAHDDFLEILSAFAPQLKGGIVHCFTGSQSELERYLALGLCIGITGFICDERRGTHLRKLVAQIPPDRLMIETDAPFLRPRDLKVAPGRRNEPAYLPHIAETVAHCAGRDVEDVWRETTEAAVRLFGLS